MKTKTQYSYGQTHQNNKLGTMFHAARSSRNSECYDTNDGGLSSGAALCLSDLMHFWVQRRF